MSSLKYLTLTLPVVLALSATPAIAQQAPADHTAAVAEADRWLTLLDQKKYAEAWASAAELFRSAVTVDQFAQVIGQVRNTLGQVGSREPSKIEASSTLPGMPDGEYVVIEYQSAYSGLPRAIERMVLEKDEAGDWKVVGSFVRPAP